MNPIDHYIDTRLGTIRVRVSGAGIPILMWPSLLMDHSLWDMQVAHFAPRYTTVAIDPPGHGLSSRLTRKFTFDECADTVVDILDALGLAQTHFLGNSWGAMIGGTFAARHPDRVLCSVLMNGTASAAPLRQRIKFSLLLAAATAMRQIRPPLTGAVVSAFLGPTSRDQRPRAERKVVEIAKRNDVKSAVIAVRSVVSDRPDQHELLKTIRTPTLVIAGREDAIFPLPEVAAMAAAIPAAEYVIIDDAAHLVALEVPNTVNSLVETFITSPREKR